MSRPLRLELSGGHYHVTSRGDRRDDIYHDNMGFKHDPAKAAANLNKPGGPISDAEGVIADPLAVTVEAPDAEGEQRFITVGLGSAGELVVLVRTERSGEYRPISARRPTRKERKHYEN